MDAARFDPPYGIDVDFDDADDEEEDDDEDALQLGAPLCHPAWYQGYGCALCSASSLAPPPQIPGWS